MEDQTFIDPKPFETLVSHTELSINFRLTTNHITCKGSDRQNVSLATQLLSHTSATALRVYQKEDPAALRLADFISLVNSWFDVMNSRTILENQDLKKPFGLCLEKQINILNEMFTMVSGMRCAHSSDRLPFQEGILVSIMSTKALLKDMRSSYENISFLLTKKLNQDALENLFGQIRTRGGLDDHPSPLSAIYRIRMIILGKSPGVVQSGVNCLPPLDEEFVAPTVYKSCDMKMVVEGLNVPPRIGTVIASDGSSLSSADSDFQFKSVTEKDGHVYLSGSICRKFRAKYPFLGNYTFQRKALPHLTDYNYCEDNIVQTLSHGGLMEPSKEWLAQSLKLEQHFLKCHKDGTFRYKQNVSRRLTKLCVLKYPDFPKEIMLAYFKHRSIIRMRTLNTQILEEKNRKKRKNFDKDNKTYKKFKRIIN